MKYLLCASIILISVGAYGQEWAPIGAEWYYDVTHAFSGNIDYQRVYCDSSISIKGIFCKRINIDHYGCNNHFSQKLYTYESDDTVFFYNTDIDTFQVLYNFNALKGECWEILIRDHEQKTDTVFIKVDSTGISEINGEYLKKLYVTYEYHFTYLSNETEVFQISSVIIEKLGDLEFLINIMDKYSRTCDVDYIGSLRCYFDSEFGLYSTGVRDSCTYEYVWISFDSNRLTDSYTIYPNPVKDILMISDSGTKVYYELYNSIGYQIKSGCDTKIDFTSMQDGNYILRITSDGSRTKTIKIIKH